MLLSAIQCDNIHNDDNVIYLITMGFVNDTIAYGVILRGVLHAMKTSFIIDPLTNRCEVI